MRSVLFACVLLLFAACQPQSQYPGYQRMSQFRAADISSDVEELIHKKSGASVVLVKNDDQARTFMVGFRTPPYDDTGLFHIFEHAVLAGSRLFPSKSNFFHILNSSVASFVNAMTGSIQTQYPFVTRSPEEFDNMMDAYLDAVFFPNAVSDPRIIQREGWRYEVDPKTKKMSINGIVLSEMKGAFSSPYRTLSLELNRALLPNTPYAKSSGGLPSQIATLSFEQIRDAHKKYYHPQNSVIYLYGDLDFKKTLRTIDQKFLKEFQASKDFIKPELELQGEISYQQKNHYGTYPGETGGNRDFLAKGFIFGSHLTNDQEFAAAVLMDAFVDNVSSPLKLRMYKEGLAKSTFSNNFGGEDNAIAFVFEGSEEKNLKKINKIFYEEVEKIVKDGLDPKLLESILNSYEFSFKSRANRSHRGLSLSNTVINNWLLREKTLKEALNITKQFQTLRKTLGDQKFIQDFFKKYLAENKQHRWVILKPDPLFSQKFNAGLEKQVSEALEKRSIEEYSKEFTSYQTWVEAPEAQPILDTIPKLKLSEIKADEKPIAWKQSKDGETQIIEYPQATNGITYVQLFFDLKGVAQENLKKLDFLTSFLKKTNTANFDFKDLSKEIASKMGGLYFSLGSYQSAKDPNIFKPTLSVTLQFLEENKSEAFNLTQEVLTQSLFEPTRRVDQLLAEIKNDMKSSVASRAPGLASGAATKSFYPQQNSFYDELGGASFEAFAKKGFPRGKTLARDLKKIQKNVFNQERLFLATITSRENELKKYKEKIHQLKKNLPETGSPNQVWDFSKQTHYDGFSIPGEVQYVVQASSYKKSGLPYSGAMRVYSRYLNNNFM
ncbi:MAG: insulinase family protein, partial [Pseudomonadota bacterium]